MKGDNLSYLENVVQHLTANLIKNQSFIMLISHFVKRPAQVLVADEGKFYDQNVTRDS